MQPTGAQLKQLNEALLSAFDHNSLEQFVFFQLEVDLQEITPVEGSPTLRDIVNHLVRYYAAKEGGLKRLFNGAIEENSGNPDLIALQEAWSRLEFDTLPMPEDHPSIQINYIEGDNVSGDKIGDNSIKTGNVSGTGIAIGTGARAEVHQTTGMDPAALAAAFAPLITATQSAPPEKQAVAAQKVEALQAEAMKGEKADDEVVGGLVQDLADLVPGAVSAIGTIFGGPLLGGLVGPATKFVLKRIGME